MKVRIKSKKKKFEPLVLKITIDSEKELANLWHRFNISESVVADNSNNYLKIDIKESMAANSDLLFAILDSKIRYLGLMKEGH